LKNFPNHPPLFSAPSCDGEVFLELSAACGFFGGFFWSESFSCESSKLFDDVFPMVIFGAACW
jgi:hypothetical protein